MGLSWVSHSTLIYTSELILCSHIRDIESLYLANKNILYDENRIISIEAILKRACKQVACMRRKLLFRESSFNMTSGGGGKKILRGCSENF